MGFIAKNMLQSSLCAALNQVYMIRTQCLSDNVEIERLYMYLIIQELYDYDPGL